MKTYSTEALFQADCFQWFWNNPDFEHHRQMLFHVQQKAKNRIEGARFKAMGVVKGVSDFILVGNSRVYFIELKLPGQTQFKEQETFEMKVKLRGHEYFVIETLEEFKALILRLLK